MLNKEDKSRLYMLGFLVVYVVLTFVFVKYTKFIPFTYIGLGCLLLHNSVIMSVVAKRYFKVFDMEMPFTGYVPFVNQLIIFPKSALVGVLISIIAGLLFIVPTKIPVDFLHKYFKIMEIEQIYDKLFVCFFMALFVMEMFIGLGIKDVYTKVDKLHRKMTGTTRSKATSYYGYIVLCFIPIIRILVGLDLMMKLKTLAVYNDFSVSKIKSKHKEVVKGEY